MNSDRILTVEPVGYNGNTVGESVENLERRYSLNWACVERLTTQTTRHTGERRGTEP